MLVERPLWYLYAGGLLWVRNSAQICSVISVRSVREKTFTKYASSPVGVTSHITPLPAGEGLGEGPLCALWEKKLPSESQKRSFSHREHRWAEHTGLIERGLPSLDPCLSPLRVLLFRPPRHCLVAPFLSMQQVFPVVKNHYISSN